MQDVKVKDTGWKKIRGATVKCTIRRMILVKLPPQLSHERLVFIVQPTTRLNKAYWSAQVSLNGHYLVGDYATSKKLAKRAIEVKVRALFGAFFREI